MTSKQEQTTMRRWFFWVGWSTERLEAWLEGLAREGWHLTKADRWLNRFHFVKGPAKQVRICVDYQTGQVPEEYRTLFRDAGWHLVAEEMGYYMWRTEYEGAKRPEIFSDVDSLIERNRRLMGLVFIVLIAQVPVWTLGLFTRLWQMRFGKPLLIVYGVLISIAFLIVIGILRYNMKLRSRKL